MIHRGTPVRILAASGLSTCGVIRKQKGPRERKVPHRRRKEWPPEEEDEEEEEEEEEKDGESRGRKEDENRRTGPR